jgi:hypothetical protein
MALNRVVLAGLLLAFAGSSGCTSVQHIQPSEYLENHAPPVVWVTYTNNNVILVANPEIRRDTLRGLLQGERVKIPMSEIQTVKAKVRDHTKTAVLVTALGVAVVSSMYVGFVGKGSANKTSIDCTGDEVAKHPDEHPECSF